MSDLPLLDETRCTGCGDCVPICPVDCLELQADVPWLARPEDCVACGLCALVCPEDAVAV